MIIKLFSVPVPGQCIEGEDVFLGTVRLSMHKASVLAIATSLQNFIQRKGFEADIEIVDMQDDKKNRHDYGILNYKKIQLIKYRVGASFESVISKIQEADIIAVSINYTHSRLIVSDFIEFAKGINPKSLVIVGGTEASAEPLYYLKKGANVVVKGEGEKIFDEIVYSYHKNYDLRNVPGIFCRYDEQFIDNTKLLSVSLNYSIHELSPQNLEFVNYSLYTDTGEGNPPQGIHPPFISFETSRGCTEACSFCATPFMKGRYRFMEVSQVINHLEYYWDKGIRTLLFQEDNILSRIFRSPATSKYIYPEGRNDLIKIFNVVREMGFSWEFSNGLQFGLFEKDESIDEELINVMFWNTCDANGNISGCYRATIPLENLADENFRKFRKLKKYNIQKQIIQTIAQQNVSILNFNLIIGRPEDDINIVKLSYDRCCEVKELVRTKGNTLPFFNVYNLSLLPGTVDYRKYKNLLAFDLEKDPEVITFYLGSLNTSFFDAFDITAVRGSMAQKLNGENLIKDIDEVRYITNDKILDLLKN
jgi:radical SAM superfamily enzyme YgiQ (UPF0313 family)